MPELKLARLPDRTPVKLSITILPDLHQALLAYAEAYARAYDRKEEVVDLIPAMLAAYIDADRDFAKHRN